MFVHDHETNRLGYLEQLPPGVDLLMFNLERIGHLPLDVGLMRRAYSIEECNINQKIARLVAYCKFVTDVADGGGNPPAPKILAFVDGAHKANFFNMTIQMCGVNSLALVEDDSLQERLGVVEQFIHSETNVLVCTDAAVVGLGITFVDHVIHLDLPSRENFDDFNVRTRFARRPNGANDGHVHVVFDTDHDVGVAQNVVDYINNEYHVEHPLFECRMHPR